MTPSELLIELLERVGTTGDVLMSEHELSQWNTEAVVSLKKQKLVTQGSPANSTVCPGCEKNCFMPVEKIPGSSSDSSLFVVCDKRSDINRVDIHPDHLRQWRSSPVHIAKFIAISLSLRWRGTVLSQGDTLEIGVMKGTVKSQMLCLRSGNGLVLIAGSNALPLADVVDFTEGLYALDTRAIEQLVDASTTTDDRYTPSNARREARKLDTRARNERWKKEYRKRKKEHSDKSDSWCAIQISKMDMGEGRSFETIRKNMK